MNSAMDSWLGYNTPKTLAAEKNRPAGLPKLKSFSETKGIVNRDEKNSIWNGRKYFSKIIHQIRH